jgi:hypothetical protein
LETIPDDLDSLLIMPRVALLDDYQGVALRMADWKSLPPGTEVVTFPDHLDEGALAKRLADFDVVMAMRERTPTPRHARGPCPNSAPRRRGTRNTSIG